MTDEEIEAARAIEQAATPGPWTTVAPRGCPAAFVRASSEQIADAFDGTNWTDEQCQRNADFIAASRTLVPRLLDHVQWLEGEVKRYDFARRQVIAERDDLRDEVMEVRQKLHDDPVMAEVDMLSDRITTIADENCGIDVKQTTDDNLDRIERKLFEQRVEVERMRPVYEAALEWATSTRTYKPDGCDDALQALQQAAQDAFNAALASEAKEPTP